MPPDERRAAIIEAVRPLLIEHGDSVTTRQIAGAAGIAEGTIFRVFTDKAELLDAALDAALDPAPFELSLRAIDPELPLEERLVEATEIIQQRVVNVWALVSNHGSKHPQHVRRPMTDSAALAGIFAADASRIRVEPVAAARMLRALTLSLTHPMLAGEKLTAAEIVATVLHGIKGECE